MARPDTLAVRRATRAEAIAAEPSGALGWLGERWAPLAVGAVTALAFGLRLALVRDSLLGDELFMFNIVHDRSLGDALSIVRETEKTPPLFFILVWASAKLGDPTVWSRVPSLVLGTALVPLAYVLGLRTVGRVAAVLGAAILALDPFAIFYATENRAYAAIAFLAALSTWCLLRALETSRPRWWVAYGLAVVAVLYTHYVGVFVLLVQGLWAFWTHRERIRELIVVHGLIVLAFVPWLPSYLVQQSHSSDEARRIASLAPPSLDYFGAINARALLGHPTFGLGELPGRVAAALGLGVVLAAAVAAGIRVWRVRPGLRLSSPIALLALVAVATPVGVGLISLRPGMSFMLPRNLSPSLTAAVLVVGWLLVSLRRRAAIAAVAVMLVVLAVGATRTLDVENRRTPWREVAKFIDARARPGDPVVQHFYIDENAAPRRVLAINFKRPHPFFSTPPPEAEAPAWDRGRHGAHVFVAWPLPGNDETVKHAGPRTGPGNRFVLVAEGRYEGLFDVVVGEYALPGR
jgi:Dolichyl-phosphate-mannose-protein mannosyltransferase